MKSTDIDDQIKALRSTIKTLQAEKSRLQLKEKAQRAARAKKKKAEKEELVDQCKRLLFFKMKRKDVAEKVGVSFNFVCTVRERMLAEARAALRRQKREQELKEQFREGKGRKKPEPKGYWREEATVDSLGRIKNTNRILIHY